MLEGVISILEGLNPRMVETKLQGFLADAPPPTETREASS
jgi:chemotaxis protein MotA